MQHSFRAWFESVRSELFLCQTIGIGRRYARWAAFVETNVGDGITVIGTGSVDKVYPSLCTVCGIPLLFSLCMPVSRSPFRALFIDTWTRHHRYKGREQIPNTTQDGPILFSSHPCCSGMETSSFAHVYFVAFARIEESNDYLTYTISKWSRIERIGLAGNTG